MGPVLITTQNVCLNTLKESGAVRNRLKFCKIFLRTKPGKNRQYHVLVPTSIRLAFTTRPDSR